MQLSDDEDDLLFDPDFQMASSMRDELAALPFGGGAMGPTDFEDSNGSEETRDFRISKVDRFVSGMWDALSFENLIHIPYTANYLAQMYMQDVRRQKPLNLFKNLSAVMQMPIEIMLEVRPPNYLMTPPLIPPRYSNFFILSTSFTFPHAAEFCATCFFPIIAPTFGKLRCSDTTFLSVPPNGLLGDGHISCLDQAPAG